MGFSDATPNPLPTSPLKGEACGSAVPRCARHSRPSALRKSCLTQSAAQSRSRVSSRNPIKIWSAAASTGVEAYTIAIVLAEFERVRLGSAGIVFATDISTEVLQVAQAGIYPADVLSPISADLRARYLMRAKDRASGLSRIVPELRARVQQVNEEWRRVLTEAFAPALQEYGFAALSRPAAVSLVMTMAQGYMLERLSDIEEGHEALLSEIEAWMKSRTGQARSARPKKGRPT